MLLAEERIVFACSYATLGTPSTPRVSSKSLTTVFAQAVSFSTLPIWIFLKFQATRSFHGSVHKLGIWMPLFVFLRANIRTRFQMPIVDALDFSTTF